MTSMLDDKDYRKKVSEVYARVAKAFDSVDPDLAEIEEGQGTLAILARQGKVKIILSPQPPVQQIWLASASQGVAVHFSWDNEQSRWMDDKGKGFELFAFVAQTVAQTTSVQIQF